MAKKVYDDDDGRTIADMSGVSRKPLIVPELNKISEKSGADAPKAVDNVIADEGEMPEQKASNPWEEYVPLSKKERRYFITGALGATALIASIFIIAAAVLIALILIVWG